MAMEMGMDSVPGQLLRFTKTDKGGKIPYANLSSILPFSSLYFSLPSFISPSRPPVTLVDSQSPARSM
jgi:hypothetical protein